MKKLLVSLLLVTAPMALFAQFRVFSDGTVLSGSDTYRQSCFTNAKVNMESYSYISGGQDLVGLQGSAYMGSPSSGDKAVGVFGIAGNGSSGHNMGVAGYLGGSCNGAGIFGTTYDNMNYTIPGMYAGFFNGYVYATSSVTASSFLTTSDLRLKNNVCSIQEKEGNYRFLDRVLDMNVIEYNLKDKTQTTNLNERMASLKNAELEQRHIGLAAQELQNIIPELVIEGQDGYLAVNYNEMVPVLIRAIQELKAELDEVKGIDYGKTRSVSESKEKRYAVSSDNVLYQNNPNPFKEQTVIRFKLADDIQNAQICIFDMTGKTLKKLPISSGMDSVSIGGYELGEGMFLYSLIVNGQEIDTKRMIISK